MSETTKTSCSDNCDCARCKELRNERAYCDIAELVGVWRDEGYTPEEIGFYLTIAAIDYQNAQRVPAEEQVDQYEKLLKMADEFRLARAQPGVH